MDTAAVNLVEKHNYTNKEITYLKNMTIREYDIKSAGFTIIKYLGNLLDKDTIELLEKMPKIKRNIYIGKEMRKNSNIPKEINRMLAEIRKTFVIDNDIRYENILSIKKDALFIINQKCENTKPFNFFTLVEKNSYTSYMGIGNKELYYSARTNTLHIKGVADDIIAKQEDYIIKDIKNILGMAERLTEEQLLIQLRRYRSKYVNKQLPIETYRDLDSGGFLIDGYVFEEMSDNLFDRVDISQNYIKIILPIIQALL